MLFNGLLCKFSLWAGRSTTADKAERGVWYDSD